MKGLKNDNSGTNNRYSFNPFSTSMILFEDELILNNIHFIMETISKPRPSVKFTFKEKDIELVDKILSKVELEASKQEVNSTVTGEQKTSSPAGQQRKIVLSVSISILIIILITVLL